MIQYYQELLYYVQKMVGDKEKAKDIIQESYSRMLDIDKITPIENKRAFLYKLARNIVFDIARKDKHLLSIEYYEEAYNIPQEQQPDELLLEENQQEILFEILDTIPAKNAQAFILHVFEGFNRKEIASKMGISVSAVEKHIIRATEKIKEKLESIEGNN
ncbi:RNA polymerase sigma factor [Arcobacter lacus]|jgi:RNA polymerase sigma-70 factor (ECF subfamily)|uniref:RNA polymerase subunit sigma n=2 Tax=Arcobacteraceae TaxID=2808963 RepID=A0ABX5JIW2_9BACT|nr:RNA polymerase sigma factor [Arcobacter lacus]MCT7910234.1 RNA polymerase sigma factor [Arcobacter lacus]PUE66340.1 RNA polymerase subunit sigma [Arcobacter lacus]